MSHFYIFCQIKGGTLMAYQVIIFYIAVDLTIFALTYASI